jgi:hypothetical protein
MKISKAGAIPDKNPSIAIKPKFFFPNVCGSTAPIVPCVKGSILWLFYLIIMDELLIKIG